MTQVNGTNALMIQIHDAGLRLDRTGHQPTQVTTARMPRPRSHLVSHYMSEQRSGNSVELRGFEPLTPSMRTRCATGLRYSPENLS